MYSITREVYCAVYVTDGFMLRVHNAHVDGAELTETNVTTRPWFCTNCITGMFPFNNLEDDSDFINIASGSVLIPKCFKPSSDLCFKSVYVEDSRQLMNSTDPDPDANYYNSIQLPQSQYVTSCDLDTQLKKIKYRNKFSLVHANCRSMEKNFNNLLCTINSFEFSVSVIAVSET